MTKKAAVKQVACEEHAEMLKIYKVMNDLEKYMVRHKIDPQTGVFSLMALAAKQCTHPESKTKKKHFVELAGISWKDGKEYWKHAGC